MISRTAHPEEADRNKTGETIKVEGIEADEAEVATGDEEEDDLHESWP